MENAKYTAEDIQQNKTVAALANIPVLFWLPFAAAKDSPFAKFYCNQGFWLLVVSIVASILSRIGIIGSILGWILSVLVAIFAIIGIVGACKGQAKEVPALGKITVFK